MAKYTVPGIDFQEIDNTVRSNSVPGLGIGAIVMKSNKGPVNQRILTSSYDQFTQIYGEPENLDDYGHFAAENYLAISNQLLTVRATMGDEGYAQIQFPYTDAKAEDTYKSKDVAQFKFVNNEGDSNLKLLQPLETLTNVSALTNNEEWVSPKPDLGAFYVNQRAQFATVKDLITDNPAAVAVYKTISSGDELTTDSVIKTSGQYVEFVSKLSNDGKVTKWYDDLIFTQEAWESSGAGLRYDSFAKNSTPVITFDASGTASTGYKVVFTIPGTDTLNGANNSITAYFTKEVADKLVDPEADWGCEEKGFINYPTLFDDANFFKGNSDIPFVNVEPACKIQFRDWDDGLNKEYFVKTQEFEDSVGQAVGIQYREYGYNDLQEKLAGFMTGSIEQDLSVTRMTELDFEKINELANEYGCEPSDIATEQYALLKYYDVWEGKELDETGEVQNVQKEVIIYYPEWLEFKNKNDGKNFNEYLFWIVAEKDGKKATTVSTYVQDVPETVVIPWQDGIVKETIDENVKEEPITKMTAIATSEILNGTNETYRDGYTMSIESDDEPGNGDIEQYVSNKENQLIIASIGPGEYGNDVGVSVITTECAGIPALNHQNAFNWKYRYDDEDQVDNNADDLTWEKVYRINVYVKSKTQTPDTAWGSGMDALLKDPVESWFVSNDPQAKDAEGNSLYAPNVINGHSEYIYVSRNSVNEAKTGAGTYAQPHQTYAIYQLTGGSNSKKNNMTEKTAALKLYRDRQKADFDILFNVESVDTFNGKQRYMAHQRKIAEIAAARKIDIGVVQVSSRESKTVKKQLSEAKMFSFNNGTYVAEYAGYDKYYNGTLASWIYLPKSVAGACAMAYCDMYAYPWMAPAGVARGKIQYTVGQLTRLTDDEIGQLYDCNVNTSRECGGFGEVLWGHKTALKKESALNRINVRRCLNYIEKQLEQMMVPYLFQQNTENTRSAAKNSIDAFLSRVQAAEGLESYSLSVTQDNEDPHIMNVNIRVVPAESIEYISVKITVDRNTGVTAIEG